MSLFIEYGTSWEKAALIAKAEIANAEAERAVAAARDARAIEEVRQLIWERRALLKSNAHPFAH